jgi:hypothetical protein
VRWKCEIASVNSFSLVPNSLERILNDYFCGLNMYLGVRASGGLFLIRLEIAARLPARIDVKRPSIYCRSSKVRKSFFSSIRCLRAWETSTANSP